MGGPGILVPLGFFAMVTAISVGIPLVRALSRHWERQSPRLLGISDVGARLERIEQAVDAMSLEIERISEGQRFVTKLLSDTAASRTGLPSGRANPT
ncbi:MAG: hypothetical protein NVS4B3_06000 [Gemmatimonadaceae bacterium]